MICLNPVVSGRSHVRMLLQVHDELVLEVAEERAGEVASQVVEVMESAVALSVPLRVETGLGKTWYDCKQ